MSENENQDSHHLEIEQKFSINSAYESLYMSDTYNSEDYNSIKSLMEEIPNALDKFLEDNPDYDDIRKIDINKIKVGDAVVVTLSAYDETVDDIIDQKYNAEVTLVSDDNITVILREFIPDAKSGDVRLFSNEYAEVNRNRVSPDTNIIFKLKGQDIALIFSSIRRLLPEGIGGNIEYFYVFTEYFKINEKICYQSLSADEKYNLNDELEERTGIPSSRGGASLKW